MTDDIEQLKAQMIAAQRALREAEDREFCKPGTIKTVLNDIAAALGGINGSEGLSLGDLASKIIVEVGRVNRAYTESLWSRDGRGC